MQVGRRMHRAGSVITEAPRAASRGRRAEQSRPGPPHRRGCGPPPAAAPMPRPPPARVDSPSCRRRARSRTGRRAGRVAVPGPSPGVLAHPATLGASARWHCSRRRRPCATRSTARILAAAVTRGLCPSGAAAREAHQQRPWSPPPPLGSAGSTSLVSAARQGQGRQPARWGRPGGQAEAVDAASSASGPLPLRWYMTIWTMAPAQPYGVDMRG